jgi:hypothetical protein
MRRDTTRKNPAHISVSRPVSTRATVPTHSTPLLKLFVHHA